MLLRVVRLVVVGAAVLLALHLFMLAGHGQAGHGPMGSPGPATHATLPMDQPAPPTLDHHLAMPAGVDMAATCFAVLAALLLLGARVRHGRRVRSWPGPAASDRPAGHRPRPRARSPVELCVSRT
jgi:hypothetical protein